MHNSLNKYFGGFTKKHWDGHSGDLEDPEAFIFSLDTNQKFMWKQNRAIYCDSRYGPYFGNGTDFGLYPYPGDKRGRSNVNDDDRSYSIPKGEASSLACVTDGYFDIREVEVYQIIFQ